MLGVAGCHGAQRPDPAAGAATLQLTATDFANGGNIPASFTCDGGIASPALAWSAPPAGTKSLALIAVDPDAPMGTFVHWVLYNLPASARSLSASVPTKSQLPDGSSQGKNDFDDIGYGGPCPPGHSQHHYEFTLYALDTSLNLLTGATRREVEESAKGHILARGRLVGVYHR